MATKAQLEAEVERLRLDLSLAETRLVEAHDQIRRHVEIEQNMNRAVFHINEAGRLRLGLVDHLLGEKP